MKKKIIPSKIWSSKVFWAIVSLIASLMLWVYVTDTEGDTHTDTFNNIPVRFTGEQSLKEQRGLIITDVENTSVTLTLRGDRRTISQLDPSEMAVIVDVSNCTYTGRLDRNFSISYPSGVDPEKIDVVSRSVSYISFLVDKISTRSVELVGVFNGSAAEGFMVEPLEFAQPTIRISGPESDIALVDEAEVVVELENVDRTQEINAFYVLKDKDGNEVDLDTIEAESDTVLVTLPVLATKDVPLALTVIAGGGATEADVNISFEPVQMITIAGDTAVLSGINKIDLGTVDLSEITDIYERKYTVKLDNNIQNLTGVMEVNASVEIKGLQTEKFVVTNITCSNVTAGYRETILTGNLEVVVRGRPAELAAIEPNDIRAVADLSDLGDATGIYTRDVEIFIAGAENAAAFGKYQIYVSLEKSGA